MSRMTIQKPSPFRLNISETTGKVVIFCLIDNSDCEATNYRHVSSSEQAGEDEQSIYSYASLSASRNDDGLGFYASRQYADNEWNDAIYLSIDPHILATPAIADVNNDGSPDVSTHDHSCCVGCSCCYYCNWWSRSSSLCPTTFPPTSTIRCRQQENLILIQTSTWHAPCCAGTWLSSRGSGTATWTCLLLLRSEFPRSLR
jgi:hypothetical protein